MRTVYVALLGVLLSAAVAQFFLAGFSAIDPAPAEESFTIHAALGYLLVPFSLLVILAAALARAPGRLIGMTALVTGLLLAQPVISFISGAMGGAGSALTGQLAFGLHAVNGLAVLGLLGATLRHARRLPDRRAAAAAPRPGAQ